MKNDYIGTYPILKDEREIGKLLVDRQGAFWRFEAECEMLEGLVRISVYGGGTEGYLGIMEPREDRLYLCKMLSRSALTVFPPEISYCGISGHPQIASGEAPQYQSDNPNYVEGTEYISDRRESEIEAEATQEQQCEANSPPCTENGPSCECAPPQECSIPPPEVSDCPPGSDSPVQWSLCGCPSSLFSGPIEKAAAGSLRGVLTSKMDDLTLIAIPEDHPPHSSVIIISGETEICEKRYLVGKIKNGKSIP